MALGLAGGDAEVEVEDAEGSEAAAARSRDEEILPQKRQASADRPTASQVADHELTHIHYGAWCPDCVETFGRKRAHHAADPSGRVVPLIAVDYCFLIDKGIERRNEVEFDWESAPENVLRFLIGCCSKRGYYFMRAVPKKGLDD